ncbi:MAG: flavoprotein, partial [Rikenellaceae bacterium]
MKVVVGITAASGAIYARQVIELLLADTNVEQIGVIFSRSAREVAEYEGVSIDCSDERVTVFDRDDMFAPVARGS